MYILFCLFCHVNIQVIMDLKQKASYESYNGAQRYWTKFLYCLRLEELLSRMSYKKKNKQLWQDA